MELPALKFLITMVRLIPRPILWKMASPAGWIASLVPGKSKRIFRINRKHVIRPCGLNVKLSRVYRNILRGVLDFARLNRVSDKVFRKVVTIRGEENMRKALSKGRGVLAITAHYSAWELIPRAVALQGHKVGVVTRKLAQGRASAFFDSMRARHGAVLIDRASGITRLMRALRDNTAVGILIDQDTMGVESDFVDFMGLKARTPVGPAQLALRFGIPVLTLHISGSSGGKYELTIDEPLDLSFYEGEKGYLRLTADLTGRIEEWIREDPEQWIWIHERWARRPGWAPGLR